MSINYTMENDLDWQNAEVIEITPRGWKTIRVSYIDAQPFVFWRINNIQNNFRSDSKSVSMKGVHRFFSDSLESLKIMIEHYLDGMHEERKRFYKENIVGLFDE